MKKDFSIYGVKSLKFELKDFDEGSRKVAGYFASFDTLDNDNDIIRQGAFSKSIAERGPLATEDSKGLYFVSQLGRSTKG
jgi:phage head maturation protease